LSSLSTPEWRAAEEDAMSSPRITYTSHPDATPQAELNVLANVYRFILDCHARKKKATGMTSTDTDDAKSKKEEGGGHVKQLANKSSEIVSQRLKKRTQ
jgi:hypothetical protein